MNFATRYQKPGVGTSFDPKEMDFDTDWVKECESQMHMKEGFHIEHEDEQTLPPFLDTVRPDREYLDIAAG